MAAAATKMTHVPRGASVSNEYVYFIVMFIETKKRTGAR